jgi:hypothetical protein
MRTVEIQKVHAVRPWSEELPTGGRWSQTYCGRLTTTKDKWVEQSSLSLTCERCRRAVWRER